MKITSETATQLIATDKNYGAFVAGPILGVIGLVLIFAAIANHNVAPAVFGILMLLIGAALIIFRKARTLTIDRGAGTLNLATKGITGGQTLPYQLADVVKLQLISQYQTQYNNQAGGGQGSGLSFGTGGIGMGGNTSTQQTTHLLVVMRDGTTVDIADGTRSVSAVAIVSHVPNQDVGEHIAAFIGVPLEVVGPTTPSLGSVVGAVENMMHHNDTAPSVAAPPPAPPSPPAPAIPPTPNGAGFAMPHAPVAPPMTPTSPTPPPASEPVDPNQPPPPTSS